MPVIHSSIITEKSMQLLPDNRYTLRIDNKTNKISIAKEIAKKFKVKVINVRTMNVKGKIKYNARTRQSGKKSDYKKAIITLAKGDKIPGFETDEGKDDKKAKK